MLTRTRMQMQMRWISTAKARERWKGGKVEEEQRYSNGGQDPRA